ncbi:hypothetical protein A4S05_08860 [Nostoc sp. KVJ20]|uniref:carboxypeptidase-like regulatory domain-containing protein n=1 Tax=Nostoc sp. KVJ20 TaxID=457944 RepID=UPI00083E027F|nr:carboxypeptidase-like regulatory domain-containing protein [Nostoc sp. KVJ20]ODG98432.1 hypothetical protein A4S05_08860 [Nostoc sp. KVJ20]
MQSFKLGFVVFASIGLLFLGACGNQASESSSNPSVATSETATNTGTTANSKKSAHGGSGSKNAQVVEAGKYHLEFVPEKEGSTTHLDLYLQTGDKHEAVPNAKVTADIQSPDGKQKTVTLTYDADGKHYATKLEGVIAGQYQVKVTANVGTEKVNGRFSFNQ